MANLEIVTIVLDGLPWITHHLPIFNRLKCDWRWTVCEGVSAAVRDTRWMQAQLPRLSNDGTHEYLLQIAAQHPRVRFLQRKLWDGKTVMCNACLDGITADSIVLQVDADEIWQTGQIEKVIELFEAHKDVDRMQFFCRYHLGPNIVATPSDGTVYGCRNDEWMRAWRIHRPDQRFVTHEPPVMSHCTGKVLPRDVTRYLGIEFDHFAYATMRQVEYKERVYGYEGATIRWMNLQKNTVWPTKLKPFMHWVDDRVMADLLVR